MTVYVLHIVPPYRHARHYVGYTPDADPARRIDEHLSGGSNASPLIRAALAAGCEVLVAHVFSAATRQFESYLKSRNDVPRWCALCNRLERPVPALDRIPIKFRNAKPTYERNAHD